MLARHKQGEYYAGEHSVLFRNRLVKNSDTKSGFIFLTGYPSYAYQVFSFPNMRACAQKITDLGIDFYAIDGGGPETWGNDVAVARTTDALTFARASLGWDSDPVVVGGYSMGGLDAQNWAARNLAQVAGFVGFAPASDLDALHGNGAFTSSIDTAYGGSFVANSAGHSPGRDLTDELATKPWKSWYATDDTTIDPTSVEDVSTAVGGSLVPLTGGHVNFWTQVDPDSVADYVGDLLL